MYKSIYFQVKKSNKRTDLMRILNFNFLIFNVLRNSNHHKIKFFDSILNHIILIVIYRMDKEIKGRALYATIYFLYINENCGSD